MGLPKVRTDEKYTRVYAPLDMNWGFGASRGAEAFALEAQRYKKGVFLRKEEDSNLFNAKSIIDILHMRAVKGRRLEIVVEGTDRAAEETALRIYSGLISESSIAPYFGRFVLRDGDKPNDEIELMDNGKRERREREDRMKDDVMARRLKESKNLKKLDLDSTIDLSDTFITDYICCREGDYLAGLADEADCVIDLMPDGGWFDKYNALFHLDRLRRQLNEKVWKYILSESAEEAAERKKQLEEDLKKENFGERARHIFFRRIERKIELRQEMAW